MHFSCKGMYGMEIYTIIMAQILDFCNKLANGQINVIIFVNVMG